MVTVNEPEPPVLMLEDIVHRPEWHQRAACAGMGTDQFIVAGRGHYGASARALCESCPVRAECLETARADLELVGLWGGTTTAERRKLPRGKPRQRRKAEREEELHWAEGELVEEEDALAHAADWWA